MSKNYTTKTAALNAIVADIHLLKSDEIDAKRIKLNGESIKDTIQDLKTTQGFQVSQDYLKLVSRLGLSEDDDLMLLDDYGNVVYCNFISRINSLDLLKQVLQYNIHDWTYDLEADIYSNINRLFANNKIKHFNGSLKNTQIATSTFNTCKNLISFTSDLSNLQDGSYMLSECNNLKKFTVPNLDKLTNAKGMFWNCHQLEDFNYDLPSLVDGAGMFSGSNMVKAMGCPLKQFKGNLDSLQLGGWGQHGGMFEGCSQLTVFESKLPSLTAGPNMFSKCKLNKASVLNIVNCLKDENTCTTDAYITIGIDQSLKTDTELQSLLGISEGATSASVVGHGGATWNITLEWN